MSQKKTVIAINGSPRKKWNTATLLQEALEGAETQGAETEMIHLYDLNFKGCTSCFSCKKTETYRNGQCAMRDDLSPVLTKVMASTAVIMGSPIYLSDVTGEMRSFLERLVFMNLAYDLDEMSILTRGPSCGFIYTMNLPETMMKEWGYPAIFEAHTKFLKLLKGRVEYMTATDTLQFHDYSKYHVRMFDPAHKAKMRERQFPLDCRQAFEMGARLAAGADSD